MYSTSTFSALHLALDLNMVEQSRKSSPLIPEAGTEIPLFR
jgi:hypothetical protein